MKAVIFNAPGKIRIGEIDTPQLKPEEALIAIKASGLCGTDLHIYDGDFIASYPVVPGHEFAGEVVDVGTDVIDVHAGDKVAIDPSIYCNRCKFCRENKQNFCENYRGYGIHYNGGFAEYAAIHRRNLYPIEGLSYLEGAMVEPVACGIHGMKQIDLQLGEHVLIFGCGPIGLILMQLCQMGGAATVTMVDIQEDKLELAEKLRATNILLADNDLKQRLSRLHPDGFHVVIDATGNPRVVERMFDYVRDKGRILFFGVCPADAKISISPYDVYKRELKICGTFALLHTARQAVDVIKSKKVDVQSLVSHQFPLEDFEKAFALKQQGKDAMKIMIVPVLY
jgi:2-desacetyl-2-hydroxyethyl bacteriochlorophyllide A dehydrogenase